VENSRETKRSPKELLHERLVATALRAVQRFQSQRFF
jgi:hypothetical protein